MQISNVLLKHAKERARRLLENACLRSSKRQGEFMAKLLPSFKKVLSQENLGMAGAIVLEPTVEGFLRKFLPQQSFGPVSIEDIAGIVLGSFLSKKGKLARGFGKGMVIINLAQIMQKLISGGMGASASASAGLNYV